MKLYQELNYGDFDRRICTVCKEAIAGVGINDNAHNPITNRKCSVYYHVKCFTPRIKLPYSTKHINHPEILQLLVEWNSQFNLIDANSFIPESSKKDLIQTNQNVLSRQWIEIMKFLTPEEISRLACISKSFYYYSWNIEVWKEATHTVEGNTREVKCAYLKKKFNSCLACGESEAEKLYNSLLLKGALCFNCHKNVYINGGSTKYALKHIGDLLKIYRIDRSFIERNHIPILIDSEFYHYTYPALIEKELVNSDKQDHSMLTRKKRKIKEES